MSEHDRKVDEALSGFDESKRQTLTRLITGSAYAAPIVASFAMDGLTISKAQAQVANGSALILPTSDRRLKTGIMRVARHPSGVDLYRFRYRWSDVEYVGVMAQEVLETAPHAVITGEDGFLRVDYSALGLQMLPYDTWSTMGPDGTRAAV